MEALLILLQSHFSSDATPLVDVTNCAAGASARAASTYSHSIVPGGFDVTS
jgi:hypothetical protein